jgi:hypothetical protein
MTGKINEAHTFVELKPIIFAFFGQFNVLFKRFDAYSPGNAPRIVFEKATQPKESLETHQQLC